VQPNLDGKVAVVTGAGRGIGRAIGLALGKAGAHVVVAARTAAQIEAVAKEVRDAGGRATALTMDLADQESVRELFAAVRRQPGRLDVLINNAGIGLYGQIKDFDVEDLDRLYRVNLRGAMLCCQEAMRIMEPQRSGYIINIASVVGFKGYPNQGGYTATKHGIMGLTKVLAVEAQPNDIRVSAILPGGVDTDLIAQARPDLDRSILMQGSDVADTVLFLLSLSDRAAIDQVYLRRRTSQPF